MDLEQEPYFRTLVVSVQPSAASNGSAVSAAAHDLDEKVCIVLTYLASTTRQLAGQFKAPNFDFRLVLPTQSGFVVRSDFLALRTIGCRCIHSTKGFATPWERLEAPSLGPSETTSFVEILSFCAGAVVLNPSHGRDKAAAEMAERLSFPWILSSPMTRKRLIVVGHRHPEVMAGYLTTAYALGIRVALVAAEENLIPLELQPEAVEKCIPIDMTQDALLPTRIAAAVSATGPYHGIITFTDTLMVHTAKTAQLLGLHTLPLDAVQTCLDKHSSRLLCGDLSQTLRTKGVDDLPKCLETLGTELEYPLIVRPCSAWGSQGVFKATNKEELFDAVSRASSAAMGVDILIDSYVDGPEIDANFVLQDGRVLFFEVVDGFPCTAEMSNIEKAGNFLETDQVWPSKHPQNEQSVIRSSLLSLLLGMGIRDGIFHVEARIKNSAVHYTERNGVFDLYPRETPRPTGPSAFLLEVNQRPPGQGGSRSTAVAHGVDYPGLYMLCALQEKERYRALSCAFPSGAIQWVNSVFINTEKAGIYDGDNVCRELSGTRPDLMEHVQYCICYYVNGQHIKVSPARVALFVVSSSISRQRVIEIAREIRKTVVVKMRYDP